MRFSRPWPRLRSLPVPRLNCLVLLGALGLGCSSHAAEEPARTPATVPKDGLDKLTHEQLARKLMEVMGAADLGKQVLDAMSDHFAKMPGISPEFIERFKQNAQPEQLTELIVPVYVKYYDPDTLRAAIRFYQSKEGRNIVEHMPQATAASMEAGREWGQALAQETLRQMASEAPDGS